MPRDRSFWIGLHRFLLVLALVFLLQAPIRLVRGWLADEAAGSVMAGILAGVGLLLVAGSFAARVIGNRSPDPWARANPNDIFELRVQLTSRDLEAASGLLVPPRRMWRISGIVAFLALVAGGAAVASSGEMALGLGLVAFGLLFIAVLLAVVPIVSRKSVRLARRARQVLGTQHRLRFGPPGYTRDIQIRMYGFEASWSAMARLLETDELFVIRPRWYLQSYNLVVPKRFFEDAAQIRWFREQVQARWPPRPTGTPTYRSATGRAPGRTRP